MVNIVGNDIQSCNGFYSLQYLIAVKSIVRIYYSQFGSKNIWKNDCNIFNFFIASWDFYWHVELTVIEIEWRN